MKSFKEYLLEAPTKWSWKKIDFGDNKHELVAESKLPNGETLRIFLVSDNLEEGLGFFTVSSTVNNKPVQLDREDIPSIVETIADVLKNAVNKIKVKVKDLDDSDIEFEIRLKLGKGGDVETSNKFQTTSIMKSSLPKGFKFSVTKNNQQLEISVYK